MANIGKEEKTIEVLPVEEPVEAEASTPKPVKTEEAVEANHDTEVSQPA